jgi:hypothetical protein
VYGAASYPTGTATLADLSTLAGTVIAAQPTVVVLATNKASTLALATALKATGYTGDVVDLVLNDERMFVVFDQYKALDGALTFTTGIGTARQPGLGVATVAAQLTAAGFPNTPVSTSVLYGWATADFLIRALQATPEPLTTEALANNVNGGSFVYPGYANATCPSVWPLQHVVPTPCGHLVRIDAKASNGLAKVGYPGVTGGFVPVLDLTYFDEFLV